MDESDSEIERIRQKKMETLVNRKQEHDRLQELDNTGTLLTLTDENFRIVRKYPLILVDFWASWCGPCRMVAPTIEQLARDYKGKVWFGKLNVDENPATSNWYGIQSIPAMLLFKNGVRLDGIVGAIPRTEIESFLKRHMEHN